MPNEEVPTSRKSSWWKKDFFNLKNNHTTWQREVLAGLVTFFAVAYILVVNTNMLSGKGIGMPAGGVFIATCLASFIATMFMGLFANVPYALAPGMGLNSFIAYTVVIQLGFSWQEALVIVFLCGIFNILVIMTPVRKFLIKAIPESLQHAISGGIGVFVIFVALIDSGLISLVGGLPSLHNIDSPALIVLVIGLVMAVVLNVLHVKGAMLITIVVTALIGLIPFAGWGSQITQPAESIKLTEAFTDFGKVAGAIFGPAGFASLFRDASRLPLIFITMFALSMSDTFDTIGTFIGTGIKSNIFSKEDLYALEHAKGFKSRMDKALFADAIATSIGASLGATNTTTFAESATGINEGARTGLASVVTALGFFVSIFLVQVVTAIPHAATAPVLILVGCIMLGSFKEVKWNKVEEAIPAMFASLFMAFTYSISYGIAYAFIAYILVEATLYISGQVRYTLVSKNKNIFGRPKDYQATAGPDGKLSYTNAKGQEILVTKPRWKVSVILEVCALLFLLYFILIPLIPMLH